MNWTRLRRLCLSLRGLHTYYRLFSHVLIKVDVESFTTFSLTDHWTRKSSWIFPQKTTVLEDLLDTWILTRGLAHFGAGNQTFIYNYIFCWNFHTENDSKRDWKSDLVWILGFANHLKMSVDSEDFEYLFKIVLIGDSGVGKSNLLTRYTRDEFYLGSKATIGVELAHCNLEINGKKVRAQIWDTAGKREWIFPPHE